MTVTVRKATAGRTTHDQHRTLIILRVVMAAAIAPHHHRPRHRGTHRRRLPRRPGRRRGRGGGGSRGDRSGHGADHRSRRPHPQRRRHAPKLSDRWRRPRRTSTAQLGEAARTNLADSVEGTAQIADRVADVIEGIERFIPGNSDSLAEELRTVSDGLEPVPEQLRTLGDQLVVGSDDLQASMVTLDALSRRIEGSHRASRTPPMRSTTCPPSPGRSRRALEKPVIGSRSICGSSGSPWSWPAVPCSSSRSRSTACCRHRRGATTTGLTTRPTARPRHDVRPAAGAGLPVEHDLPSPPH